MLYPNSGDFLVDDKFIFEIGGKNKSFSQIKDIENSFVVSDDIEIGSNGKIPLWLFVLNFGFCGTKNLFSALQKINLH